MTFAVMAFVLLGFVGFSTEVGGWFLARTTAQAAADGAAVAAVLVLNGGGDLHDAQTAAAAAMASPNWSSATPYTLTVTAGTNQQTSPPTPTATTVVSFKIPALISMIFTGTSEVTVNVQSTAGMQTLGSACVLSTQNDLTINAPQLPWTNLCSYVSNATDQQAINVLNDVDVKVYALVTAGGCSNCPLGYAGRPPSTFQPPVLDPYQSTLASINLPASSSDVACINTGGPSITGPMVPATPQLNGKFQAYCSENFVISSNVTMTPGVYLFVDATLTVMDSGTLVCQTAGGGDCFNASPKTGVTIIFTGSPVTTGNPAAVCSVNLSGTNPPPTLKICSFANVNIGPAAAGDLPAEFANLANFGVLFWRDASLSNSQPGTVASPAVDIQVTSSGGSSAIGPTGLLYFPGAVVSYGGTAPSNRCTTLLAGTISLNTNASKFWDCGSNGQYITPQVFAVRILE
jgi:hypothetical protein